MIALTRAPIDIAALNHSATDPACGAVLTFSGTVRNQHLRRPVEKLIYEAYEPMAQAELERIAQACRETWPDVRKVQIVHRFGEMAIMESSVYITLCSPHRNDAFPALRFVIDSIKRDVPIWKKEFYADGESDWLHPKEGGAPPQSSTVAMAALR